MIDLIKLYLRLLALPLKYSVPIIMIAGLVLSVVFPILPSQVKELLIQATENFLFDK